MNFNDNPDNEISGKMKPECNQSEFSLEPVHVCPEDIRNYSNRLREKISKRLENYIKVSEAGDAFMKETSLTMLNEQSGAQSDEGISNTGEYKDPLLKHAHSVTNRAKELRAHSEALLKAIQNSRTSST